MILRTLARYFNTIRYLRAAQVAARLRFKIRKPRPDLRPAPSLRPLPHDFATPITPAPTLLGPDTFRFLNVERRCTEAADWTTQQVQRLWLYHLHYFDDLNARDASQRTQWHLALLARWVTENPPGYAQGWEPYPISRRIVNWVKWAASGNPLAAEWRASLAVQARWLMRRLEYHIPGNHLIANAKALVYAGLYFQGGEAERWYAVGVRLVERELTQQVLSDGGHFELSTMYHAVVLEDLLDLVNISHACDREVPADWLVAIGIMRRWLLGMSHPDGDIAFFNDAALGVSARFLDLEEYAARLRLPATDQPQGVLNVLLASGYVCASVGPAYLLCDCARVGPDCLPGHAHADTLTFELSLFGHRIFVNSGTSQYEPGPERLRQRGTAAHNTVTVDGFDSSEVWDSFRVARRARAYLRATTSTAESATIDASHDGYRRLPGRNEHRRRWVLDARSLHIEDTITGRFHSAEARFHLHPDIEVHSLDADAFLLSGPTGLRARVAFAGAASVAVHRSKWHPAFGVFQENRCIVAGFLSSFLAAQVTWEYRGRPQEPPTPHIEAHG